MIQANELRIGNYVYRTNKQRNVKITMQLTASFILDISANGVNSSFVYEPIELTEEILLKCGFELCYNQNNYKRYEIVLKETIIYLRPSLDKWYWGFINDDLECEINDCDELIYLHTLQNLIYALTNQELTINL